MNGPPTPGSRGLEGGVRPELKVTSRPTVHPRTEVWPRRRGLLSRAMLGMDEGQAHWPHGRSSPGDPRFYKEATGPPSSPKMLATLLSSSMSMMNSGTTCRRSTWAMPEDRKLLRTKVK